MSQRKTSMTMADLEAIHENRVVAAAPPTPVDLNEQIFEEICQDVANDDLVAAPVPSRMNRRGSLSQDENDLPAPTEFKMQYQRRHSSYEPTSRHAHREAHDEFKDYFQTLQDTHAVRRASFVSNLLEFNLSASMSSFAEVNKSAAMHFSCPIMSYMNDDEEDSVELRLYKRPSMTYVGDDSMDNSWESLKEDEEEAVDGHDSKREYVIELPPLEEFNEETSSKKRRRKPHSYKMLEQQLSSNTHQQVLKSFSQPSVVKHAAATRPPVQQPKSLQQDTMFTTGQQTPMVASARPATARGA